MYVDEESGVEPLGLKEQPHMDKAIGDSPNKPKIWHPSRGRSLRMRRLAASLLGNMPLGRMLGNMFDSCIGNIALMMGELYH
jgi:hypothetical protein